MEDLTLDEMLALVSKCIDWNFVKEGLFQSHLKYEGSYDLNSGAKIQISLGYEKPIDSPCEEKHYVEITCSDKRGHPVTLGKAHDNTIKQLYDKIHACHLYSINMHKQATIAILRRRGYTDR